MKETDADITEGRDGWPCSLMSTDRLERFHISRSDPEVERHVQECKICAAYLEFVATLSDIMPPTSSSPLSKPCPDDEMLLALTEDTLPEFRKQEVTRHTFACDLCADRLAELTCAVRLGSHIAKQANRLDLRAPGLSTQQLMRSVAQPKQLALPGLWERLRRLPGLLPGFTSGFAAAAAVIGLFLLFRVAPTPSSGRIRSGTRLSPPFSSSDPVTEPKFASSPDSTNFANRSGANLAADPNDRKPANGVGSRDPEAVVISVMRAQEAGHIDDAEARLSAAVKEHPNSLLLWAEWEHFYTVDGDSRVAGYAKVHIRSLMGESISHRH